jgi:hypothetical protein
MDLNAIGKNFATAWVSALHEQRFEDLFNLLSPTTKLSFHSPVVNTLYQDRDKIEAILQNVVQVFQNFTYINSGYVSFEPLKPVQQQNPQKLDQTIGVVLLFRATITDPETGKNLNVEGVDVFEIDQNGKVVYLKVMVRPLKVAIALAKIMAQRLTASL